MNVMVSYHFVEVCFAMDGCRRRSFKDFDSHEAHW